MSTTYPKAYKKLKAEASESLKTQNPKMSYDSIGAVLEVAPSNISKWIKQLHAGKFEEDVESVEKIFRSDIKFLSLEIKEVKETLDHHEDAIAEIRKLVREIHKIIKDEHDEIKADAAKAIGQLNKKT